MVGVTGISAQSAICYVLPSYGIVDMGNVVVFHTPTSVVGLKGPSVELEGIVNGNKRNSTLHPDYKGRQANRFYYTGSARRRF